MAKLTIDAVYWQDDNRESFTEIFDNKNLIIKIKDGDEVVAETDLESLVTKFLMMSSEYARVMAAIGAVKAKDDSKIVLEGPKES